MNNRDQQFSTRKLLHEYRRIYERKSPHLKKALGQHLLANSGMLNEIARICEIQPESLVIEIGAGIGNLTQALLRFNPLHYIGIELDEEFKALHQRFFATSDRIEFIYGDVLQVDFARLVQNYSDVIIVGNIPYQITSPLLIKLLLGEFHWSRIVLTLQKEVAERLVAISGTKKISVLTYKVQIFAIPRIMFFMSPSNFIPPPKVESAVVKFIPHPQPLLSKADVKEMFRLLDAAFAQRRKTILNTLTNANLTQLPKEQLKEMLSRAGINPACRAEDFSLAEFISLLNALKPYLQSSKK
ncbi:MAG: 16S rRNA (adenine(1518)-N(6)/adenine(1519)-N(6))-dimethyltransferase RsmA [Candidatus Sumerlaeia bacterium]|nr:16S rRNA (adenine(1518)-N(6)/adenine(1519)-N(6))-dimethyltransferase RsmA [Candidatus Sumerlaeia bacterium]